MPKKQEEKITEESVEKEEKKNTEESVENVAENNYFTNLFSVNVNDKTEKKNKLTYLSWTYAMAEMLKRYPNMTYDVELFEGKPYIYDAILGYIVFTNVTLEGITRKMWLPVMDGANNAMLDHPYEYITRYGEKKTVAKATMFDINKTIMRCLTKNFAMFGLGLYIYAGEDLPEDEAEAIEQQKAAKKEAAEKKAENSSKLVTPADVKEIEKLAAECGSQVLKICSSYKVANLAELNKAQYEDCIALLKRKIEIRREKANA